VKKIIRGEKDEVRAQCFEWGWVYIHFKNGKHYEVIGLAHHTETREELVIYRSLYKSEFGFGALWVRLKTMFFEDVFHEEKWVPRFEKKRSSPGRNASGVA
jgi:hypothetical protein